MKRTLRRALIWGVAVTFYIYLGGYLYLKYECMSVKMAPADPWKGSSQVMIMRSQVTYWDSGDFSILSSSLSYRDPGLDLDVGTTKFLNVIFLPIQKVDKGISGWAVKFKSENFRL